MRVSGPADMVIRLRIRRVEPLAGSATTEGGAARAFEGWMELMGVIADLIGSPKLDGAASRGEDDGVHE
jgi:hypothetical protein